MQKTPALPCATASSSFCQRQILKPKVQSNRNVLNMIHIERAFTEMQSIFENLLWYETLWLREGVPTKRRGRTCKKIVHCGRHLACFGAFKFFFAYRVDLPAKSLLSVYRRPLVAILAMLRTSTCLAAVAIICHLCHLQSWKGGVSLCSSSNDVITALAWTGNACISELQPSWKIQIHIIKSKSF